MIKEIKDSRRFAGVHMYLLHIYNCCLSGLTNDNLEFCAFHRGDVAHMYVLTHTVSWERGGPGSA